MCQGLDLQGRAEVASDVAPLRQLDDKLAVAPAFKVAERGPALDLQGRLRLAVEHERTQRQWLESPPPVATQHLLGLLEGLMGIEVPSSRTSASEMSV